MWMIIPLLFMSCGVQKPIVEEKVTVNLFNKDVQVVEQTDSIRWKDAFTDTKLQALISEALEKNADVRTIQLSLEQAEIQLRMAKLSYLPAFAFAPSGTISITTASPIVPTYELPITMQWELNLAGGQHAQKEMSKYAWMQMQERLLYTQLQLVASVANMYYTLVMLDEQIRLTNAHIQLQEETLKAMRILKEVGQCNDLAVNQTEASYQETVASLNDLKLSVIKTEQALNLLLCRTPGTIERSSFATVERVQMNAQQPVSLEMLASRPDVKDAEYALRAAFSNTKVARSQFYPTLQINANGAWTNNIGEVINPAKLLLNIIGTLTQPLFRMGQIKGQFDIAKSQQTQAQIAFEQTLLQAGSEVGTALVECDYNRRKEQDRQRQVAASQRAYEQSLILMEHSSINYLEILTAQSSYLSSQLQATADWMEAQQGAINLFKALCPMR